VARAALAENILEVFHKIAEAVWLIENGSCLAGGSRRRTRNEASCHAVVWFENGVS
jgi:hypothetical protein